MTAAALPSDVRIRPFTGADLTAVSRLSDEAFRITDLVPARRLERLVLEVDTLESLARADHAMVAEREGRVIGVLMGQLPGAPRPDARRRARLGARLRTGLLVLLAGRHLTARHELRRFSLSARRLLRQTGEPLGPELTLFVVGAAARGTGIGTAMLTAWLDLLRAQGVGRFHLHTDSRCTWEYYEARGMRRAASDLITVTDRDGRHREIETYLYVGDC